MYYKDFKLGKLYRNSSNNIDYICTREYSKFLVALLEPQDMSNSYIYKFPQLTEGHLYYEVKEWVPKTGDHVHVKRSGVNEWFDRFYLFSYAGKHYTLNILTFKNVTVNTQFEHNSCWDEIRKAVEPALKITVEINGKPARLSDISKETLESLRSKN